MSVMILLTLGLSLFLYLFFAGADLGAGILELIPKKDLREEQEQLIQRAMGPMWEANHIWMILALVVFFTAYPKAFSTFMTYYHFPLSFLLFGILLRGTSFTFRHYDPVKDWSHHLYHKLFTFSSLWSTLWMGILAGSLIKGIPKVDHIDFPFLLSFWCSPLTLAVGAFMVFVVNFIASVFLISETKDRELKNHFMRRGLQSISALVITGAMVFFLMLVEAPWAFERFFTNRFSLGCFILSTLLLYPLWRMVSQDRPWSRYLTGIQIFLVMFGGFWVQYPLILNIQGGQDLTYVNTLAPLPTQRLILWALGFGFLMILPFYFYLLKIFKGHTFK